MTKPTTEPTEEQLRAFYEAKDRAESQHHRELKAALDKQASCPPQVGHDWEGQAQDATPLQAAHGALDCAIDELSIQIRRLEDRLQDVLEPDEDEEPFPQPPSTAAPRCSNAVRRAQQQEDRINVLRGNIVDLLNRLEC